MRLIGLVLALGLTFAPFCAAQPRTKIYRIGYLGPASPSAGARLLESFRQGLRERGYVGGQNMLIDYRWADGIPDRFPALTAELKPWITCPTTAHGAPVRNCIRS